jgi:DNA-binding NtrC family response regulator
VLASTHVELPRRIAEGRFREDLFYRLNVVSIEMPALAERGDDVIQLLHAFASSFKRSMRFTDAAIQWIRLRPWPGNVRELRNAVERLALLSDSDTIDVPVLEEFVGMNMMDSTREIDRMARSILALPNRIGSKLDVIERAVLHHAVEITGGNKSAAARLLGVHRKFLERRLDRASDSDEIEDQTPEEKAILEKLQSEKPPVQ